MNKGLLDFLQSASNAVASNVSGPIDMIGMGLNKIGVPVGAAPVGGTDWMKSKGLMRDVEQGPARVLGETAGLLGPALASKFAPQIARGLLQGGENLAAPARLNKEAGRVLIGPQSDALETAQKNATEMLGLPPNNTATDRAKALGFDVDTPLYHGTSADIAEFNPALYGTNTRAAGDELGIFTTAKKDLANQYAEIAGRGGWYGRRDAGPANVMPLVARMQNPKKYETASGFYRDADAAASSKSLGKLRDSFKTQGFDSVQVRPDMEEVVLFQPNQLRSRFAAFDPARVNENDLLGRADLGFLGLLGLGAGGAAYAAKDGR